MRSIDSWRGYGNREALLIQAWTIIGLSVLNGTESMTGRVMWDGMFWWPLAEFGTVTAVCVAETVSARIGRRWSPVVSAVAWKSFGLSLAAQAVVFGVLASWSLVPIWTGYVMLSRNAVQLGRRIMQGAA